MRKKISVTKDDIKNGIKESCSECPAAIACRREGLQDVKVFGDEVAFGNGEKMYIDGIYNEKFRRTHVNAPRSLNRFIKKFDSGKKVSQFSFFLDIPENALAK